MHTGRLYSTALPRMALMESSRPVCWINKSPRLPVNDSPEQMPTPSSSLQTRMNRGSVSLASGRSRPTAFYSAVLLAITTIVGVLLISLFPSWVRVGLPLSAGVAIYVAATDLVPEVNREPGIRMALIFFAGVAIFFLIRLLAPAL